MNDRFFEGNHHVLVYERKEGTKQSFYNSFGRLDILPKRISWGSFAQKKESNKDALKKSEINGVYLKNEMGLYSGFRGRKVHTSIWKNDKYPEFFGYGIIDERYNVRDLVIIYSSNNCKDSFEIHVLISMGYLDNLDRAFEYLRNYKIRKP